MEIQTSYIEFDFTAPDTMLQEQLIALLSEEGFEGFEESGQILKAFVDEARFDEIRFNDILSLFREVSFIKSIVKHRNWNEQWESSFEPVKVGSFAAIRAQFHKPVSGVKYEIVVTPKMSFGTGHHPTTYLMIEQMSQMDFRNQTVIDFGTGTGVLAILAEKMGAARVEAIDNDNWSIDNASENIAANNCNKIKIYKAETLATENNADIILANINLNVISGNLNAIYTSAADHATVLFSGLLVADSPAITILLREKGFEITGHYERDNWLAIKTQCNKN